MFALSDPGGMRQSARRMGKRRNHESDESNELDFWKRNHNGSAADMDELTDPILSQNKRNTRKGRESERPESIGLGRKLEHSDSSSFVGLHPCHPWFRNL